jgi:hypothetical protein
MNAAISTTTIAATPPRISQRRRDVPVSSVSAYMPLDS